MAQTRDIEQCEGKGTVHVRGRFYPNGSSAMTTGNTGVGWSVARTSAGVFTISFTEKYANFLGCNVTIQMNAATDLTPQLGAFTAASGANPATLVVRSLTAATATDIAANAANSVCFDAIFSTHSSIK